MECNFGEDITLERELFFMTFFIIPSKVKLERRRREKSASKSKKKIPHDSCISNYENKLTKEGEFDSELS